MLKKKCNGCFVVKNVSDFGIEKRALNGYKPRCKDCSNKYYRQKYKDFRDKKIQKSKTDYYLNKDLILPRIKKYYENNKEKILLRNKIYLRKRKIEFPHLKTLSGFRSLVKSLLKNKAVKTFEYLGYSFEDLILSLGRLPNSTEHIDHKIPISWFTEDCEMKLIFSLENLHILNNRENESKGNRFSHPVSKEYLEEVKPFIKEKYLNKLNHE